MSLWLNTKRVARYGLIGFIRNGFVSLSAVLIMAITLLVVSGLMISGAALQATLKQLTEKVDVNVYFRIDATEAQITDTKTALESLPEVASVGYTSRDEALAQFRERHKNDQLTIQALDELSDNPLGASLEIRAKQTSQYESVAKFLDSQQEKGTSIGNSIDKVNFYQNKTAIDRLTDIINTSERTGIAKTIFLAICAILIVLNTIRLTIYTARNEIGVMNIVGANRWYVRGPFMVAGVLYGVVSGIAVLILLYPILLYNPDLLGLGPTTVLLFGTFNYFAYYTSHFPLFFGVLIGTGIALGALSSYLAVRRYLRN